MQRSCLADRRTVCDSSRRQAIGSLWPFPPRPRLLWDTYAVCILGVVAGELVFDWDEANMEHIARHNVTSAEVEQVFANDPMDLGADVVDGEERYNSVGHTNRLRVLVVAWTMRRDTTRPITAFDASAPLTKRYLTERGL